MMDRNFVVAGVGELLWDVFPDRKRLGGAPMNFCYHCQQLGAQGVPVSAVGSDELGAEIRAVLAAKGVTDEFVAEDAVHPTGTVRVELDGSGKPAYEICEGVAWDYILLSADMLSLAARADAVCFGSLGQRMETSRKTIQSFVQACPPAALKLFDINLRQDFYSREIIEESLELCGVLKLSDEELPVLAELFGVSGSIELQLESLRSTFDLKLIAYTRGPDGSLLVSPFETSDHPGHPGVVVSTVGAGDSFTAALCMGLLRGWPLDEINDYASQVATFVCSQKGATPVLPERIRNGGEYA